MFRFAAACFVALASIAVTATDAGAHPARVYNRSDVEVKVVIYHFSNPSTYWQIPLIEANGKSRIVDLDHGWRIVAVADAITGNILALSRFRQQDLGTRIHIRGEEPNLKVEYEGVNSGGDL